MTSEQISEKPLPPDKNRCPHCGGIKAPTDEMCWQCLEKFSFQEGPPNARPMASAADAEASPDIYGVWAIGMVVAALLCLGFEFGVIGALAFGLLALPPVILYLVQRKSLSVLAWCGILLVFAMSGFIACGVICTPEFDVRLRPTPEPVKSHGGEP